MKKIIKLFLQSLFYFYASNIIYTTLLMGIKILPTFITVSPLTLSWMSNMSWALVMVPSVFYFFGAFSLNSLQCIALTATLFAVYGVSIYFILTALPILV